jgi:hypothetical protein
MPPAALDVPAPLGISPETTANPKMSIRGAGPAGDCVVTYCGINQCGGIYWIGRRMWSLWSPIGPVEFVALLETNGVNAKNPKQLEEWHKQILTFPDLPRLG